MFKKSSFNLAIVLVFVLGLFAPGANQIAQAQENQVENAQSNESEVPTNRIIIKYKEGTNASFMPALEPQMQRVREASNWSLEYVREMSDQAHVLELPQRVSAEQMEAIVAQLESLPEVEYAEPDRIYHPTVVPNDSLYGDQWYLHDTWGINAPAAWDKETGSTNVVIAVLDTGIAPHGDITDRTIAGYDFISQDFWNATWVNYTANDGDGRDNDPSDPGDWITVNENNGSDKDNFFLNCGVSYSSWHGTHVAGIIGAKTNNNDGIAGVDWNARILPVRVLGKCGGYTSDIVDGMRWAAGLTVTGVPANANPAHIINLSLGGPGSCSITEQNAVTEILNAGTVIVAAAGNSNVNVNNFSPANCTGVIAVAATDYAGEKATYSNFGSGIDISAPGDNIFSLIDAGATIPEEEDYSDKSGTSMAAPQVSGVLGLMFAINPDLTPAQALFMLQQSAKAFPDGGTCTTTNCGAGILDAGAAVALTKLPDLIITNVTLNPAEPVSGQPFEVNVTVKNQGGSNSGSLVYRDIWVDVDPRTLPSDGNGCPDSDSDYFRSEYNNSIPAGASETLSVTIDNPPLSGSHQLWAYVDASCTVAESMEDNNVMGPIAVGYYFEPLGLLSNAFNYNEGWRVDSHPRLVGDFNGDGKDDLVGIGYSSVFIALANSSGNGFFAPDIWSNAFNYNEGWRVDSHPRLVGDFNGDGKDDLVGIGYSSVFVALANSSGNGFLAPSIWSNAFNYNEGWRVNMHPRLVGDFNGDGKDDLVGIGYSSVFVALANSSGNGFLAPSIWSNAFNYNEGWRIDTHPRIVGDVNGDGKDDLIGIGYSAVFVALANSSGNGFLPPSIWSTHLDYDDGWREDMHPRMLADVNADGKDDLVGFGNDGVWVALSHPSSNAFISPDRWTTAFNYDEGWRINMHPRMLGDFNGDGKSDLVGFGYSGVIIAIAH